MTDTNTNNEEKDKLKLDMDQSADVEVGGELDDSKAKFINGGKSLDEQVVMIEGGSNEVPFTGLGKEELMRYANDPFWKKVRLILFVLFWIGWLAMLVAAIVIIVLAPRCPPRPDLKWYNTDTFYQVFTKSFKDTNKEDGLGAGVGDINGIESKLSYFEDLGIKALWISSLYPTDKNPALNYAVVDHKAIDKELGTLEDFRNLRRVTKKKGIKLILDFIPNFTSRNHAWFVSSRNQEEKFKDFYVWRPCNVTHLPSNWLSVHGGSAWTRDPERGQCYLHQFSEDEPELDLTNEDVLRELESILRFWLNIGVDGFNVVAAPYLIENSTFSDEPDSGGDYEYLEHIYTANQPGSVELVQKWRSVVDSFSKPGKEKLLIVTAPRQTRNDSLLYYGSNKNNGAHIVPVSLLPKACTTLAECINEQLTSVISGSDWRGWMMGDSSSERFGSRVDKVYHKAVQTIEMLLPGTFFNYYGDELGMPDGPAAADSGLKYTNPMCWDVSDNCGFSMYTPWNSVLKNFHVMSVGAHGANFAGYPLLLSFKDLNELRSNESCQFGKTSFGLGISQDVFWMTRKAEGFPGYLILANLGATTVTQPAIPGVPDEVIQRYCSNGEKPGKTFANTFFRLDKGASYVFEY
ncbi:hypothetical protein ScPMuIL_013710 [Solemya velum]